MVNTCEKNYGRYSSIILFAAVFGKDYKPRKYGTIASFEAVLVEDEWDFAIIGISVYS